MPALSTNTPTAHTVVGTPFSAAIIEISENHAVVGLFHHAMRMGEVTWTLLPPDDGGVHMIKQDWVCALDGEHLPWEHRVLLAQLLLYTACHVAVEEAHGRAYILLGDALAWSAVRLTATTFKGFSE